MGILVIIANIVAPLVSMGKLAPQAFKTWQKRKDTQALEGLSITTQWLVILSAVLWIILGVNLGSITVWLPTILQLSFSVMIITLIKQRTNKDTYVWVYGPVMAGLLAYGFLFEVSDWQMLLINIIAPILSFVMFVPQAVLAWKHRNTPEQLSGISIISQVLLIVNALSWGVVGYDLGSFAVMAPGLVNLPLAFFTIIIVLRRRSPSLDGDELSDDAALIR